MGVACSFSSALDAMYPKNPQNLKMDGFTWQNSFMVSFCFIRNVESFESNTKFRFSAKIFTFLSLSPRVSRVLRCNLSNTFMCAANSISPRYITYMIHFTYYFVHSVTAVVRTIITYESSSCQPVLVDCPSDSKTLIGSKFVYSVWSSKIKPNPYWCLCKYVDFIEPKPKLASQTTEPISIFGPGSVTEDHRTIEALLNDCPALYRCVLVAVDWEGFLTASWFYIVDSANPISCVEKLLAVGVQDCGRK